MERELTIKINVWERPSQFFRYIHPALTIEGKYNIRKVFRVWISLNKDEPEVTNIVYE